MAKSYNQKVKILYLQKMLHETGEDRVVTMQEILARLLECGIHAERKSIYDDIESLRSFGMDVKFKRGRPGGYYLAGQKAPEIQEDKAQPVFGKVPSEEGNSGAEEKIQPSADKGTGAAETFPESEPAAVLDSSAEPEPAAMPGVGIVLDSSAEPEPAAVSEPAADHKSAPQPAAGQDWKFVKDAVPGKGRQMKLLCRDKTKKAVLAYFGKAAQYKEKELGYFTVTAVVAEGPQFYGWLTAMGREVHILKPKKAALNYREYLKTLVKEYKGI